MSFTRIVLALCLFFVTPFSVSFFVLYFICGLSDITDGFLARKYHFTSELGAKLDSLGDFIFIAVLLYILYPYVQLTNYLEQWILIIILIRFASLLVSFIKFHTLAFLHTYANKITGFFLFCFPIFYPLFGVEATGVFLCGLATVSAVEELLILIRTKELNRNVSSIIPIKFIKLININKKR